MKFLATCLCILSLSLSQYSTSVSASSIDDAVHEDTMSFSDPWFGYFSSMASSMGSPIQAAFNELWWRIPGALAFAGMTTLNYYNHAPENRKRVGKVAVGSFVGGVALQAGSAILTGSSLIKDHETMNKVALVTSELAHYGPVAVAGFMEPGCNAIKNRGCCGCINTLGVMALGGGTALLETLSLGQSPAVINQIKENDRNFELIGKLSAKGATFRLGSPLDTKNPCLVMGAEHKRNETALLKHVHEEMNPCLEADHTSADVQYYCRHADRVTDTYETERAGIMGSVLRDKKNGLELELVFEMDELKPEIIRGALKTNIADFLVEASRSVQYKNPADVEKDKFQYFLSVFGDDYRYLIFGIKMIAEDEEFSDDVAWYMNLFTWGKISYHPHLSLIAKFDVFDDIENLSEDLLEFFGDSTAHALLFRVKDIKSEQSKIAGNQQ